MEEQRNRFKDAPWFPEKDEYILIGGAGGIGSWLTFFLARIGYKIFLYDFDRIETHNLGGQLFSFNQIGNYKVSAVQEIVKNFCNESISTINARVDENTPSNAFIFSAFDNMQARKDLFNVWKQSHSTCHSYVPIFIDGRLTAEQLQIFCVTTETMDKYEREHLFDDSEVEEESCTMKQTSHAAAMIATHMTAFFTNHLTNIYERDIIREVPFYYEYFIPLSLTEEICVN